MGSPVTHNVIIYYREFSALKKLRIPEARVLENQKWEIFAAHWTKIKLLPLKVTVVG